MEHNTLPFYDHISIKQYTVAPELRNKFYDNILTNIEKQKDEVETEAIQGLQIKAIVTHAGRLTGHYHYYGPNQVKRGMDTFLFPYPKPWLVNHDTDKDPIGRIKDVKYVSTPPVFMPDAFMHSIEGIAEHNKKSLSYMKKMKSYLFDTRFQGLGYVDALANITDPDAIAKVLDGRYQTISIGYDTNSLICSECYQDFMKEGPCDHIPGRVYEGGKMFLIFGDMFYRESSFVNVPADELTTVIGAKKINIPVLANLKDSIKLIENKDEKIYVGLMSVATESTMVTDPLRVPISTMSLYTVQGDSLVSLNNFEDNIYNNSGDEMPKIKNLKAGEKLYTKLSDMIEAEDKRLTNEQIAELQDSDFVGANRLFPATSVEYIDAAKKYLENVEDSDEKTEISKFLEDRLVTLSTVDTSQSPATIDNGEELSTEITALLDKIIAGEQLTDEESEQLYESMWDETQDSLDAKLSTEKRKSLKSSTFCGPNRSFPVPDCAHVTAAKRLIGRYKGSGDKSKIMSCINAKAKKLGCSGDEDINLTVDFTFSVDSDMNVIVPRDLCTDAQNAIFKSLAKGEDYINYYFNVSVNGPESGCSSNPDGQDPEMEKKILELLLEMYAKKEEDAISIIDNILNKNDNKETIILQLAKEQIDDLNSRIDNFKNESVVWQTEKDSLIKTNQNLGAELRDFYVNKLVSLVDKQDPNKSVEQLMEDFKQQSLSELRASVDNIMKIIGNNVSSKGSIKNTTLSYNDHIPSGARVYTQNDIDEMKKSVKHTYNKLWKNNTKAAEEFLANQTKAINALEAQIKE